MAALPADELPELMLEIANIAIKRTTRCLIKWQLHTMTSPSVAATTRCADIDFERRLWTIPAERMKKRRPHTIPLSDQALALLEALSPRAAIVNTCSRQIETRVPTPTARPHGLPGPSGQQRHALNGQQHLEYKRGWDPELVEFALPMSTSMKFEAPTAGRTTLSADAR